MKVTAIRVSSGRTFSNPYESYSNFKPHLSVEVEVDDSESNLQIIKNLQENLEQLMDDHKEWLLKRAAIENEKVQKAYEERMRLRDQEDMRAMHEAFQHEDKDDSRGMEL